MKKVIITFASTLIAVLGLAFSSCTSEDYRNCPPGEVRVFLSLTVEAGSRAAILSEHIESITLYAFDRNGRYKGEWFDDSPQVGTEGYYMTVPLEEGRYHFVAWCNLSDCFELTPERCVEGETHMDDASLSLCRDADGIVTTHPNLLFHGRAIEKDVWAYQENRIIVPIVRDTYVFNVTTEGLTAAGGPYNLSIEDNNGKYNFDNSFASDDVIKYNTRLTPETSENPSGTVNVLRLSNERKNAQLKLYDGQSRVICDESLFDLLDKLKEQKPDINVDNTYEFDIKLKFTSDGGVNIKVTIYINGWEVTEEDYPLLP